MAIGGRSELQRLAGDLSQASFPWSLFRPELQLLQVARPDFGRSACSPTNGLLPANIINAFSPSQMYATSDFDMTHQFNANWVAEFPFGQGKRFASDVHGWTNAVIGGWQFPGFTA